ncbi:MAG: alpha-amylase family glycosyl hydrolase [Bacteroidia bacterium]
MNKYIIILFSIFLFACNNNQEAEEETNVEKTTEEGTVESPSEWIQDATIYEVNVRQYTNEGTLAAFEERLPFLKDLGVDILWFMPIQPIGKLNRKAVGDTFVQDLDNPDYDKYWGSPYSIQDYTAVNPRYGSVEDFKRIIEKCHGMGIKVMLDWVGNHTAWDNAWVTEHPEWYTHDSTGQITDPIGSDGKSWGWTDVADLNYDNRDMRAEMIKSMQFWVTECDLDGFRCDVAMEVPTDFWNEARVALDEIKPMFMLAESETHQPDQFDSAFDAYYGWEMHSVFNKIYEGEADASEVIRVMNLKDSINGTRAFPMNFITNHDENSWNGTIDERMKESWQAMALLSYSLRGMPLIYSGQEVGLNHRLSFFGKDEIKWESDEASLYLGFYQNLNELKSDPAFNINSPIEMNANGDLLTIIRGEKSNFKIYINLSSSVLQLENFEEKTQGYSIRDHHEMQSEGVLGAWGYVVLQKTEEN